MTATNWTLITVVLLLMLGIKFRWRYGSMREMITNRLGPRWAQFIKIGALLSVVFWLLLWLLVSPERRAELQQFYEQTAPWVIGGPASRDQKP